jgi:hypothetical protein
MWMTTGSLMIGRREHTATLLPNGQVLVAGGFHSRKPVAKAELYDAATASWTRTDQLFHGRFGHRATLLGSGNVLVSGGTDSLSRDALASAELYESAPEALDIQ